MSTSLKALTLMMVLLAVTAVQADDCPDLSQQDSISLTQYLERSLCANTTTRAAWQRIITQKSQLAASRADYYPQIDVNASAQRQLANNTPGIDPDSDSLNVNASWLLWDFGGRRASVAQNQALLDSLKATADAQLQNVALTAIQAWFNQAANTAALAAAEASYRSAQETAKAAQKRMDVGLGTREDVLQAETALAQADLLRIQRRGDLASSNGQLAVVANYPADTPLPVTQPLPAPSDSATPPLREQLLASALAQRTETLAQQQQIAANESQLDSLAAQRLPRITGNARYGQSTNNNVTDDGGVLGLTLSMPLFTGWRQTQQERALNSQITLQHIELDRIQKQISLEVWQAWQLLDTSLARVQATDALLDAASESNRAALARYQAGIGNLLNVLNAQSNLADARQQQARARFDWASARLQLARASGLIFDESFGLGVARQ